MLVAVLKSLGFGVWNALVRFGEARAARAMANAKNGIFID